MASKLDQVLSSIDPDRTVNQNSARADAAINKLLLDTAVVKEGLLNKNNSLILNA